MTTPCPGAAALRARWTARALAGAFLDLALAWACLCFAALAAATVRFLALLPCTCARPHLPCVLAFLAHYPACAAGSLHAALRARFPFADADDEDQKQEEPGEGEQPAPGSDTEAAYLRRREEASAELQRELEKERSAAASAAEEAMAMILRLQKDKSALEIEARQQRRTAEERRAFYEDEVEELRDIVLEREREARALRKEVDAYRRLLGLGPACGDGTDEDDDDEQEMVTPHSMLMSEGEPSSSRSVDATRMQLKMGNDSGFSFKTPFFREQSMAPPPVIGDRGNGGSDGSITAVQTPVKGPGAQSRLELSSTEDEDGAETEDDGAETVEIHPHSARSQDLDQGCDFHVEVGPGMEPTKEHTAHGFQEVGCGVIDKIDRDHAGSENDANVFDVHVVDDLCFSTEVKGLIGRSFSDATMQAEKLQTRAVADDLLGKSLNAIKGAQDKIRHAASERRQSLQLQLLEDIANQLQGIKDAAEAGRHMYCAPPKSSKKS